MDSKLRPETLCIQAGYTPKNGEPRQIPIVQSTTFKYDTSEDMGKLFDLEASGYFYCRLQNPTCDYVAAKIAAMEGGVRQHFVQQRIVAAESGLVELIVQKELLFNGFAYER